MLKSMSKIVFFLLLAFSIAACSLNHSRNFYGAIPQETIMDLIAESSYHDATQPYHISDTGRAIVVENIDLITGQLNYLLTANSKANFPYGSVIKVNGDLYMGWNSCSRKFNGHEMQFYINDEGIIKKLCFLIEKNELSLYIMKVYAGEMAAYRFKFDDPKRNAKFKITPE